MPSSQFLPAANIEPHAEATEYDFSGLMYHQTARGNRLADKTNISARIMKRSSAPCHAEIMGPKLDSDLLRNAVNKWAILAGVFIPSLNGVLSGARA